MTKKELKIVLTILERIKDPDNQAVALVAKDLASYAARRGQLRDNYEVDRELSL